MSFKPNLKCRFVLISLFTLCAGAWAPTAFAAAATAPPAAIETPTLNSPTVISIVGFDIKGPEFQKLCKTTQDEIGRWSLESQATSTCLTVDLTAEAATGFLALPRADLTSAAGTIVQIENDATADSFKLTIQNVRPADTIEPQHLSWRIKKVADATIMLRKLLRSYSKFDQHKQDYKKNLLSNALQYHVDDADFSNAYRQFIQDPQNERFMAAGLEISAFLGASLYTYYSVAIANNPNARDWDYETGKQSFRQKVSGNVIRFDDNRYPTNQGHLLAGFGYHFLARSSGANREQALLFDFASSSFWEYIGEYREVVSIVDEINTTLGGFVLGETIFQISKIFRKDGANSSARKILGTVFGAPEKVSAIIENSTSAKRRTFSDLKLTNEEASFWSKLDLYAGVDQVNGLNSRSYGLSGEVINIPYYDSLGKVSRTYLAEDTVQAQLDFDYGSGAGVSKFMRLYAKIVLTAIYQKNLDLDEKGRAEGYQMFVGPAMALEVNDTSLNSNRRIGESDFMSIVHVLGGSADITTYSHGIRMHMVMDVYGDFAMIHSPSFDSVTGERYIDVEYTMGNCGTIQSVLCHEGYYYGYGATGRARVTAEKGNWRIGVSAAASNESLINQRSRFLETAEHIDAAEILSVLKGWVAFSFMPTLSIELGFEKDSHRSHISSASIPTTNIKLAETVKYGRLIWKFD